MTTTLKEGEGREFPDAVSYAVGHRIRVEMLVALHDLGSASATELARLVHQPLSTVTHHISELLKAGSIQVERTEKVRSVEQRFYSVVNPVFVDDEELEALPEEQQLDLFRVILQSLMAEALASFWNDKLVSDPRLFLSWSWFNVDDRGRAEIAEEQARSWRRIREIEREALARCNETGAEPYSLLVSSLSFKRSRTAPRPDAAPDLP